MTIGATVNPLLQQVGTLDEFKALGKPYNLVHVYIERPSIELCDGHDETSWHVRYFIFCWYFPQKMMFGKFNGGYNLLITFFPIAI